MTVRSSTTLSFKDSSSGAISAPAHSEPKPLTTPNFPCPSSRDGEVCLFGKVALSPNERQLTRPNHALAEASSDLIVKSRPLRHSHHRRRESPRSAILGKPALPRDRVITTRLTRLPNPTARLLRMRTPKSNAFSLALAQKVEAHAVVRKRVLLALR
jgi:hypothetical protein